MNALVKALEWLADLGIRSELHGTQLWVSRDDMVNNASGQTENDHYADILNGLRAGLRTGSGQLYGTRLGWTHRNDNWFERPESNVEWVVAQETVGDATISTVFLAIDHNHAVVETQCCGRRWSSAVFLMNASPRRCSGKRSNALVMHIEAVKLVKFLRPHPPNADSRPTP
jgi:hypothetical protein